MATDTCVLRPRAVWQPLWWLAYALALLVMPLLFDSSLALTLLSQIGMAIIACLSFNVLLGQGGLLSLGHALYVGAGAYTVIHVLRAALDFTWLPVSLMPLLGGLASGLLALLTGWLSTRRAGLVFAMITLGLGELAWTLSQRFVQVFGGEGGLSANRVVGEPWVGLSFGPALEMYALIAVYAWLCTLAMYGFTRTPLALALRAVRDQAERAAALGYDPRSVRYRAVVVSAFFAGVAGGLGALHFEMVSSQVFSETQSGAYLLFTVLGGVGYFVGPMVGAVLLVLATVWLPSLSSAWQLYVGLLFVLTVITEPGGLTAWAVRLGQGWRWGAWRALGWRHGAGLVGLLAWLLATVVLVEMLYQYQMRSALGPVRQLAGWTVDTSAPHHWLMAGGGWLLGGLLWRVSLGRRA